MYEQPHCMQRVLVVAKPVKSGSPNQSGKSVMRCERRCLPPINETSPEHFSGEDKSDLVLHKCFFHLMISSKLESVMRKPGPLRDRFQKRIRLGSVRSTRQAENEASTSNSATGRSGEPNAKRQTPSHQTPTHHSPQYMSMTKGKQHNLRRNLRHGESAPGELGPGVCSSTASTTGVPSSLAKDNDARERGTSERKKILPRSLVRWREGLKGVAMLCVVGGLCIQRHKGAAPLLKMSSARVHSLAGL